MWSIKRADSNYSDRREFTCPYCASEFADVYGNEVKKTCVYNEEKHIKILRYEYRCPICSVDIIQKEISS